MVQKYDIEFFKKLAENKGGKCLSEDYKNSKTRLEFECKNGHKWCVASSGVVNGHWCNICQHASKYKIDQFKTIAEKRDGKCLSDCLINLLTKITCECKFGNVFDITPKSLLKGHWCSCSKCRPNRGRIYKINHEFFSKETEEAFYVAGFFLADAYLCLKNFGTYSTYSIGLQLAEKDFNHLEKIRNVLGCTSKVNHRERYRSDILGKKIDKILYSCSFAFYSEQCFKDLERFSVFPNKTYYTFFPEWLKTHPLVHHFIRGVIDGDGCFSCVNGTEVHFDIRGTKEFLQGMHDVLLANGVCKENIKRKPIEAKDGKKFAAFDCLRYGGNGINARLYDFLYKDATIYMDRKKDVAAKAKELAVIGVVGKKRKTSKSARPITKELLLELAEKYHNQKKIAEHFKCTSPNIRAWVEKLGIKEEYQKVLVKDIDRSGIYKTYLDCNNYSKVSRLFGVSDSFVAKVVRQFKENEQSQ